MRDRSRLQERIGYEFRDPWLLEEALTHSSAEGGRAPRNYERLEFLGDRVVNLVIAHEAWRLYPTYQPHELSQVVKSMNGTKPLAQVARKLGLDRELNYGDPKVVKEPKVLADAVEAIVGAVWVEARDFPLVTRIVRNMGVISWHSE